MTGSVSLQDEANPLFLLASRAGKMDLSCLLELACFVPTKAKFFSVIFCHIMKQSRWLDIGLVLFYAFFWPQLSSESIKAQKEQFQYPAFLTERAWSIMHIPYILDVQMYRGVHKN